MKKFAVNVEETLSRVVVVEAEDIHDAVGKVTEMWTNEDIVLDSDDFCDITIEPELDIEALMVQHGMAVPVKEEQLDMFE
jgi:hypothetical protein